MVSVAVAVATARRSVEMNRGLALCSNTERVVNLGDLVALYCMAYR